MAIFGFFFNQNEIRMKIGALIYKIKTTTNIQLFHSLYIKIDEIRFPGCNILIDDMKTDKDKKNTVLCHIVQMKYEFGR